MLRQWQRFQRDVNANRPKAALMAALLLLGCCLWIPLLSKAIAPKRAAAVTIAPPHQSDATSAPIPNDLPTANSDQFWSSLAQALEQDPLFQTADISQLPRDPFGLNDGEAPPSPQPLVVPEEPTVVTTIVPPVIPFIVSPTETPTEPKNVSQPKIDIQPRTLRLTSTIISRSRRAALINGQLVTLGRQLNVDGQSYLLTQVDSNRVVLSWGEESFELKMARPQLKDVIDRRSGAGPNE